MMKHQNHANYRDDTAGNVMIYILIAVALFGALTLTLSRQNSNSDGQDLSDELIALYSTELLEYIASAQNVVDMMLSTGTTINDLDFTLPNQAGFNTPPNIHKVFHPQGGGLNYRPNIKSDIATDATSQWAINKNINIEWTASTSDDVLFTAYFINRDICANINEQITGDSAIPATSNPHANYFLDTGNTDLDTTECAECDGYATLCVENDAGDNYSLYNIVAAR